MASLSNNKIKESYQGLLKTNDNAQIDGTPKIVTDGLGNALPMSVSTTEIDFSGTIDFSAATVVGITGVQGPQGPEGPQGPAGLDGAQGPQGPAGSDATAITYTIDTTTVDQWTAGINLNGSDASTDQIQITAGNNIEISQASDVITVDGASYSIEAQQSASDVNIRLLKNLGGVQVFDDVKLIAGTNITLTADGINDTITIDAAGGAGGGVTTLNTLAGGLTLAAGTGISITDNGLDTITVASTGGGAAGLINGTGLNSLISSPALTTNPALAPNTGSIALGENATINPGNGYQIAIGQNSFAGNWSGISLGRNTVGTGQYAVAIGQDAHATASQCVAISYNTKSQGSFSTVIGTGNRVTGGQNNSIIGGGNNLIPDGQGNTAVGSFNLSFPAGQNDNVAVGRINNFGANTSNSVAIGLISQVDSNSGDSVAIGRDAVVTSGSPNSVSVGAYSRVTAANATAIGANAIAANSGWTATPQLEITNYASLNFADDATAAANGIPLGGIYHNAGALRIRIV